MKIGIRLTVGFLAVTALIWVTFFMAFNTYAKVGQKFEVLEGDVIPALLLVKDMEAEIFAVSQESHEYISFGEEESKQRILSTLEQLKNNGRTLVEQNIFINQEEKSVTEGLITKIDDFSLAALKLINAKEQGMSRYQLIAVEHEYTSLSDTLNEWLREHKEIYTRKRAESGEVVHEAHTTGIRILLLTAGFVTLLAVAISLLITRSIVNPLRTLQKGIEMIGEGNYDYKVGTEAQDEIG